MLAPALLALTCCAGEPAETLRVERAGALPAPAAAAALGEPAMILGEGRTRVWLARTADTVAVYLLVRDSSRSAADEIVVSLDPSGDAASSPRHDDFQWRLRRMLDSSVVVRGREGRWAPPRDDPEWRLGAERGGGGWEVAAEEIADGWALTLRLHAAFFEGEHGRPPRLAVRVYDGSPAGWYAWPLQRPGAHPSEVERIPARWAPVRLPP